MDFFGTGGITDHIFAQGFPISFAEESGFALNTESRMLPIFQHIHTSLVYMFLAQVQGQNRCLPDFEHTLVGAKRKVDKALETGEPAFQDQNMPIRVESGKLAKGLVAYNTGT